MTAPPIASLHNVTLRRSSALQPSDHGAALSLNLWPGQLVGVCGPSGCGKTSLLRMVAGLLRPACGHARHLGQDLWVPTRPRPLAGRIGLIPQEAGAALNPAWTIAQLLDEPRHAPHLADRDRASHLREQAMHLRAVGLPDLPLTLRPAALSVGQRQRLVLARMALAAPRLVLADEPTSALDPTLAAAVMHLLLQQARDGRAVLVISHDVTLLSAFADRVIVL